MHIFKKIMLIFLTILFILVIVSFFKIQSIKTTYVERVSNYLINEQKYEQNEIKSIKLIYGFKLPPFYTVVIFEDEPFVKYIYYAHDGVLQAEYILTKVLKNRNIDESDLKHYEPLY